MLIVKIWGLKSWNKYETNPKLILDHGQVKEKLYKAGKW